jgi:hypothetical protein
MKLLYTKQSAYIKLFLSLSVLITLLLYVATWFTPKKRFDVRIQDDTKMVAKKAKVDIDANLFINNDRGIDFELLGDRLRVYKRVFDHVTTTRTSRVNMETKNKLRQLEIIENVLFPWIRPSFDSTVSMHTSFKGDGIVLCVADRHVEMTFALIQTIRQVHDCHLPIEIYFMGPNDLSNKNQISLESLENVITKDIFEIFNNNILDLEGFGIKVFALLASSFRNAMLIDADVVFFQSPVVLFEHPSFEKHHAVFFRDRSLYSSSDDTIRWFHDIMPKPPSEFSQEFRIFHGKTKHEQESGVVLIDKFYSLPGLLAACSLNVGAYRKITYKNVFGDKETFWLGFEAVLQQYYFYPFIPGTIGVPRKTKDKEHEICSRQILHLDHEKKPLWINGGITEYKMDPVSPLARMESWMVEPGRWHLEAHNLACFYSKLEPTPIDQSLLRTITKCGEIYLQNR